MWTLKLGQKSRDMHVWLINDAAIPLPPITKFHNYMYSIFNSYWKNLTTKQVSGPPPPLILFTSIRIIWGVNSVNRTSILVREGGWGEGRKGVGEGRAGGVEGGGASNGDEMNGGPQTIVLIPSCFHPFSQKPVESEIFCETTRNCKCKYQLRKIFLRM